MPLSSLVTLHCCCSFAAKVHSQRQHYSGDYHPSNSMNVGTVKLSSIVIVPCHCGVLALGRTHFRSAVLQFCPSYITNLPSLHCNLQCLGPKPGNSKVNLPARIDIQLLIYRPCLPISMTSIGQTHHLSNPHLEIAQRNPPTLLGLPRELRDQIFQLALTPELPPNDTSDRESRCAGLPTHPIYNQSTKITCPMQNLATQLATIPNLMLACKQMYTEILEFMPHPKNARVDVRIVNEVELWPTWLSPINPVRQYDTVHVTFRSLLHNIKPESRTPWHKKYREGSCLPAPICVSNPT